MLGKRVICRSVQSAIHQSQVQFHTTTSTRTIAAVKTISATTAKSSFTSRRSYSTSKDSNHTQTADDDAGVDAFELELLNAATQATAADNALPTGVDKQDTSQSATQAAAEHKPVTRLTGPVGDYLEARKMRTDHFSIGTKAKQSNPDDIFVRPLSVHQIDLETLLANQTHFGHSTTRWNPANSPYIFGVRENTYIIALDVTASHLRRAAKVISMVTENAGLVMFVGTRPGHDRSVVPAATAAGGCYLSKKYLPGTLTNRFELISHCPLKVVNLFDEEIPELTEGLTAHEPLLPDLIVCLNPGDNHTLLHEAQQLNIPTIGIVDTDTNPGWVTYPIPANDDSPRSVQLIIGALANAAKEGRERRLDSAYDGVVSYHSNYSPEADSSKIVTKKQASRKESSRSVVLEILARHEAKRGQEISDVVL